MRKPSETRLRMLAAVGNGTIRRTSRGWAVGEQHALAADARLLNDANLAGWISVPYVPTEPGESARAVLTPDGREVLARYWPDWSPREHA